MMRRICSLLTAVLIVLSLCAVVYAQDVLDMSQDGNGSIYIHMGYAEGTEDCGSLTIYRVGEIQEYDGNYTFEPAGLFTLEWEAYEDVHSADLAQALADFAAEHSVEGIRGVIAADGTVTFSDLELGLYLVVQDTAAAGYEKISPFLIGIPNMEDGVYIYQVDASPKVQLETTPPETTEPTEPGPTEPTLPQTGQLNWPVPVMAAAGLGLFITGWGLCFRKQKEADEE